MSPRPAGGRRSGYLNGASPGGSPFRRRVCHRANTNAAAATTMTISTVSRAGTFPTGVGGPPRIFARTDVYAVSRSYPGAVPVAVVPNVLSLPADPVRAGWNGPVGPAV